MDDEVNGVEVVESMGVDDVDGVIEFVVGMEDVVGVTMGVEDVVMGVDELSFNCLRSTSLLACSSTGSAVTHKHIHPRNTKTTRIHRFDNI